MKIKMKKLINAVLLSIPALILSCCTKGVLPTPVEAFGDSFVIDSLKVKILYDDTPGFRYPMIYHSIKAVSHLIEEGNVSGYEYKCEMFNLRTSSWIEYGGLHVPGFKFRTQMSIWNYSNTKPGIKVPYSFLFYADVNSGSKYFTISSSTKLTYFNGGIRPEPNAIQLTGPETINYLPIYSIDGNWIYYVSRNDDNRESINKMDANGNLTEIIETMPEPPLNSGGFTLIDDDKKIAYVLWQSNKFSKIVIEDLQSGNKTEYEIDGYLWDARLVKVPNSNKFLELQDPNSSNPSYPNKLLIADIDTKKVDTLLKDYGGSVVSYSLNPVSNDLYVVVSTNNGTNVLKLNLETNEYSIFIQNVFVQKFAFAPNGIDYALIKKDHNGFYNIFYYNNGNERQVTTYPANVYDFCFSPDGNSISFPCERRNETQIWKIKL